MLDRREAEETDRIVSQVVAELERRGYRASKNTPFHHGTE
jgi:hypothetical protein